MLFWYKKGEVEKEQKKGGEEKEKGKKKLSHQYHFFVSQIWSSDSLWLFQAMA